MSNSIDSLTGGQHRKQGPVLNKWVTLVLFIVAVLGIGSLIGISTAPGEWYATLNRPSFAPPNWVFGPVWTVLYIMVAIAGWRTWRRGYQGLAMQIWFAQIALNFLWSPIYFGLHQMGFALIVVLAMDVLTAIFIRLTWKPDRATSLLMLPYMAWISFATLLNAAFWWLN